nr:efflux RND transporter periplasmic adaptor subunit [Novosphingobium lentum]
MSTSTAGRFAHVMPLAALLVLAACSSSQGADKKGGAKGPAQVGFVVMQPTSVGLDAELSARVTAYQMAEVRPQVSGIIRRRYFTEGSLVRKGQTLYQIDPSLYQAQVSQASANVQSAQATYDGARIKADRYRPLAQIEAISKQDYTDAAATARQASAAIAQNAAQLRTARINLNFTRVPSPITGRIGRSLMTEGALVTSSQVDPLAVIERLDPIYVDIQQSSADLLALRRALATDGQVPATARVRLKLEDGSDYPLEGLVQFSEVMVNQSTGTVTLRASFANPQGLLLPGMFVHAIVAQSVDTKAYLLPQAALVRDAKGGGTVWIVGPGNKAVQRSVVADRAQGANWVVTSGLQPGDKVIVQGIANLKANAPVRPVAASAPERIDPSRGGGGSGAGGSGGAAGGRRSQGG